MDDSLKELLGWATLLVLVCALLYPLYDAESRPPEGGGGSPTGKE
ncbi:hypothetical protein [Uliginosibacterium sp. H1]|nr:hypothetical protein [Uliginosibacterium sp. H1]